MAKHPLALTEGAIHNFEQLKRAALLGDLALIGTTIAATGEKVAVLAAITADENGVHTVVPFGHLCPANPFEYYADPTQEG